MIQKNIFHKVLAVFQKKQQVPEKEHLRTITLVKLSVLEKNLRSKTAQEKFYDLLQQFFAEYFHISYEFTYAELAEELKHRKIKDDVRMKLVVLCESLSSARFESSPLPYTEVRELIESTKSVIKEL